MGKSSKAPKPPDPYETAEAEAKFNRLDVYGPTGLQQQFGFTNKNGQFVPGTQPKDAQGAVKMFESPFDAWLRKQGEGITTDLAKLAGKTSSGIGQGASAPTAGQFGAVARPGAPTDKGLPAAATADAATRGRIESALFERGASMMRPEIERQDRGLQGRLQAMGIPIGSEAFNDTYGSFTNNVNDAWGRLAMDAIMTGGQEMERDYGLKADARARAMGEQDRKFNYGNAVRDAAIGDAATFYDFSNNQRGRDLGELASLLGGAYTPAPTVRSPTGATPINMSGAINAQYQGQMADWQARNQANQSMWGNLTSLGGAGLMLLSSREVKTDLGEMDASIALEMVERLPVHAWRYRDGTAERDGMVHIGPFAEDFHEITGASVDYAIFATDPAGLALAALKAAAQRIADLEDRIAKIEYAEAAA